MKLLKVYNIRFFKGKKQLPHSDKDLQLADCVSITFELQKRDTKNDIITQHHSGDRLLCSVRIWASIIYQLHTYPSTTIQTTVNTFQLTDNELHQFSGKEFLSRLRLATKSIGPEILGFTENQIRLHSARSGAAMAMYLAGVPVFTNMLLGRWSSNAFLRYIRKQVKEFSTGISSKMIQHKKSFTIPLPIPIRNQMNSTLNINNQNMGVNFRDTIRPLMTAFT